jgi:hypothetical protein
MMQKSFCGLQFARIIAVLTSVSGPDPNWIRSQFVGESGSRQVNMVPVPKKGGKKEILCSEKHFGGSWKLL